MVVLAVLAPFAGAIVALTVAPAGHTQIAGADVSVRPVLGRNTTELQSGAIVRPEHADVPVLGKAIGLDINVDWNQLLPQDQQTRQYLNQLWADPAPAKEVVAASARRVVIGSVVLGFTAVAVIELGIALVLRHRRRRLAEYDAAEAQLLVGFNRRLRHVSAGVAILALVALDGAGGALWWDNDDRAVDPSPAFAGTALAGTQVDGLVSEVLPFLSVLEPRNSFYDAVSRHLDAALAGQPSLDASPDDVVFVEAEDFEDVNGMAQAVGHAATLLGADFITFTGDLTFAGKPIESYIIDTLSYYAHGIPVEFAPGLHDTPAIVQAAEARGWRVADGATHEVGGVDILTLADPRVSTVGDFGTGDVLREPGVTVGDFVQRSIAQECSTHPAFVFLHDHLLGRQLAQAGCARVAVIDGRSYRLVGAQQVPTAAGGKAVEFTVGSSGGHTTTTPNPGRIKSPATFEAFVYDKATGALRDEVITVHPDASVTVTGPTPIDVPAQR